MAKPREFSRIQLKNRHNIQNAALNVFSTYGFRGTTLDQIAREAGLSKPNILYYFPSKEAIHADLLNSLLVTWLDPMRAIDPTGDPKAEIIGYMKRKLQISREYPRESRLFAMEILQGAPHLLDLLSGELKTLVDDTARLIGDWMQAGRLSPSDPYHLIFSIWSLTQHYADFDVQVRAVLAKSTDFDEAEAFLENLYHRLLSV